MSDISGDEGAGLDIRPLFIGSDYISVTPSGTFNVSVNNLYAGSNVYQGTNPLITEQNRGAFNYSGTTIIASGTAYNLITPGIGSNIMLKGFTASAIEGVKFRLFFSGGTIIGNWNIPPSGAMGMNLMGMEPSGAVNQPISAGLYNIGSLYLTVFTKDSL